MCTPWNDTELSVASLLVMGDFQVPNSALVAIFLVDRHQVNWRRWLFISEDITRPAAFQLIQATEPNLGQSASYDTGHMTTLDATWPQHVT